MTTTTIDVYADVVCPFAYVGLTRLLAHRDEIGRTDVRFRIRSWPLEVVNANPVDGHFIGEEIDEIAPQVATDLFQGFDPEQFPASSLPALALTIAAYEHDDATGERVAMALRRALFEEGRDIADPAVLAAIARQHGLDARIATEVTGDERGQLVLDEYAQGVAHGVIGSPHFFAPTMSTFCPVLHIRRVDGDLVVHVDDEARQALFDACFD